MNVFGIIGIVLLVIFIIVALVLLCPVGIIIKHNENGFQYLLKISFIKIKLDSKEKKSKKNKTDEKSQASGSEKSQSKDKDFGGFVSKAFSMLTDIIKEILRIFKHISIKKLYINCICGGTDSAETAIEYGTACAVIYPFVGYLHSLLNINERKENVIIQCDFFREKSFLEAEVEVSIKVFYLALAGIRFLKEQL